jgi:hypothetical protein
MASLKNEFSWSKTRDETFKLCPRQYWFAYYGFWNGWLKDAPERTRQIYILKNLKNRQTWAGEKIHHCIQRSISNIRRGIKVLPPDEIISITLNRMRAEFRSSRAKNYLKSPKTCALFEHEYGIEVTGQQWKEMAQNVEACLRNFYNSNVYNGLRSHGKDGWLEVEEFLSFHLDRIKIHLVIDCAVKEGNTVIIYDWKTGKILSEDLSIQLGCYALYAMEKWNLTPDSLQVVEYNLQANQANSFSVTGGEVEGMKGYIRGSVKDMQSLLKNPENNIPLDEEQFSKVKDEQVSLRCNFRKVCKISRAPSDGTLIHVKEGGGEDP